MRKIRRLHPSDEDDFAINKMDSLLDAFNNVMGVVLLIGMAVTGISLFVGGVGVMNIMFVSVTERTQEIGIRKAIGARRRAILMQFLFETSAICLVGGAIGVALSFGCRGGDQQTSSCRPASSADRLRRLDRVDRGGRHLGLHPRVAGLAAQSDRCAAL